MSISISPRPAHLKRHQEAVELYCAQAYTEEFVHGLETGTAMFHPERSDVAREEYSEIGKRTLDYLAGKDGMAISAHGFGVSAGANKPLSKAELDLGVSA
jgi:hypothetical protein